jgi:dTDP-4-dehydrorhamnose reductase
VSGLLITGAGGMLGQALVAEASARGHEHVALDHAGLDVTDAEAVTGAVAQAAPACVINCAAYTDVDGAESDPRGALAVNGAGAGNVARAAAAIGARLLHLSTDYVFDGRARRPYVESDPTGPASSYGASKLAGEREVVAAGAEHVIVRTSWLFGAGGRNFVDTMLGLGAEREQLDVVSDQVGCPTWTGHLAPALLDLAERDVAGVMHVTGGGSCSWNRFAAEIFTLAGLDCEVVETTTAAAARPAPRPAFSVLGSERSDAPRLPEWREGVRAYLAQRGSLAKAGAREARA